MGQFDYTFDPTFGQRLVEGGSAGIPGIPANPSIQAGCRREGAYLTWLTLQGGWEYHLFEGPIVRGQSPKSLGQIEQGGLSRDTQKATADTLILHTSGLTYDEAQRVGSIRKSISVYLLEHNDDDTVTEIPVKLPVGDAQLWDPATYTNNLSITIITPAVTSQRL